MTVLFCGLPSKSAAELALPTQRVQISRQGTSCRRNGSGTRMMTSSHTFLYKTSQAMISRHLKQCSQDISKACLQKLTWRGQSYILLCCQFWLHTVITEIYTLARQIKWPTPPAAMTSNAEDSVCARDRWQGLIDLQRATPDGGQMHDPKTCVELHRLHCAHLYLKRVSTGSSFGATGSSFGANSSLADSAIDGERGPAVDQH